MRRGGGIVHQHRSWADEAAFHAKDLLRPRGKLLERRHQPFRLESYGRETARERARLADGFAQERANLRSRWRLGAGTRGQLPLENLAEQFDARQMLA